MALTHCEQRARKGVMDLTYVERRLDEIDARIDDLCGLLGSALEALGVDSVQTNAEKAKHCSLCAEHYGGDNG